ncbi:MAG: methionine--tRNA ligase [Pseudomonadota bacterium]|nr:methionine--tRNA ligase [Pseudomonadota bacterium]MEC8461202.1 methionine--tRNA ligase [Pseudomonadota bacterium]
MASIFVTTSLPYANGPLHLGHLLEHIQADIWVRFKKMQGNRCVFVSGDDAHGSAIMLSAEKEGVSSEDYIQTIWQQHRRDLDDAQIDFDVFHSTRSEENRQLVHEFYEKLQSSDMFVEKSITQAYDVKKSMFLPDRYIKGSCPKCGALDQYGDHCEVCGATYMPGDLVNPYSVLTGSKPETRRSKHIFLHLSKSEVVLKQWFEKSKLQGPVKNKLQEWIKKGLVDWDVTRDAPYFGFEIPGRDRQYFYVWMDAPIGYLAALKKYSDEGDHQLFCDVWAPDSDWTVVHFIGKDIVNFHGVFWPVMLHHAGFRQPDELFVHGFLTINGEKMSKSRGTFVTARAFLNDFSSEYLRYYFAAKLSQTVSDIDLSWEDFSNRCNADLVGKVINIGSRSASFIHKYFDGNLCSLSSDHHPLIQNFKDASIQIAEYYDHKSYHFAVRDIMVLADQVNQFIDAKKPWLMVKDKNNLNQVHEICTLSLYMFRILMVYLSPILPTTSRRVAAFFDEPVFTWASAQDACSERKIMHFPRLLERVDLVTWFESRSKV